MWKLKTKAQWQMLTQCYLNYNNVHRQFQTWCRNGVLADVSQDLASELQEVQVIDGSDAFTDASLSRVAFVTALR